VNRIIIAIAASVLSHLLLFGTLVITTRALPSRVASHFGAAGIPDGWMSRSTYLATMTGFSAGVTLVLLFVFYCVRYFPDAAMNLPNRDYWLAPSRRAATLAAIFRFCLWLTCLNACFIFGIHLLVVDANRSQPAQLSAGIWVLGAC
jgi:hypothetical protein